MKIVLVVVGALCIALGLFWFGQGIGLLSGPHIGLLSGPHNAVLIDTGDAAIAIGIGLIWFALR